VFFHVKIGQKAVIAQQKMKASGTNVTLEIIFDSKVFPIGLSYQKTPEI
jgi:hypothetical protein